MKKKIIIPFVLVASIMMMVVIPFSLGASKLRGDVNGDGQWDMKDILFIRKIVAKVEIPEDEISADVNADGEVDMKDVLMLRKYVGHMDVSLAEMPDSSDESSATSSVTNPSETQPSATNTQPSTSQTQPVGDTVKLSFDLIEKTSQWDTQNRTESSNVPKGLNTVEIILPAVWHATSDFPADKAGQLVSLAYNNSPLTPKTITYGETKENANDITFTYEIVVEGDSTISGSINHPAFKACLIAINGVGGQPTKPSKDNTPLVPEANADVDLVTLTFADEEALTYGVSFHSFVPFEGACVQVVKGTVADDTAFASATEFTAQSSSMKMGEFEDYNKLSYDFYYTDTTEVTSYQHKAILSGLQASTTYSYRAGDKVTGVWSPIYTFTTKPETITDFDFIFTADFQPELTEEGLMYKGVAQVLNAAQDLCANPAFILHDGDFAYTDANGQNGISQWRNIINGCNNWSESNRTFFASIPWIMAAGNHENYKLPFFFNNANQAATGDTKSLYYSFDYGDMHIVNIDTHVLSGASTNAEQLAWVKKDLESTTKKWKIVQTHYSFYVNTNRDLEDYGTSDTDRSTLLKIFDDCGVDLVLSAHVVQNYYTTYPLKNGVVTTKDTTPNENNIPCYVNPNGTIYLQNGASGNSFGITNEIGKINGYGWSYPELMKDSEAGHYGSFAVLKLKGDTLTVQRYYIDEADKSLKTYTNGQFGITKK